MPSSSRCNTCHEKQLLRDFKSVYIRFYVHGLHREACQTSFAYSELLERSQNAIIAYITEDKKDWEEMKKYIKSQTPSVSVWAAAGILFDSADTLFQSGRNEQGKQFCENASYVQERAREIEAQEQRFK